MAERPPILMSIRAYARHRGVHHRAIQYALERGAISFEIHDDRKFINPEIADKQWAETMGSPPKNQGVANEVANKVANEIPLATSLATPAPPPKKPIILPPGEPEEDSYKYDSEGPEGQLSDGEVPALMRSKERSEVYKAKMAEIEYRERIGQLVSAEEVKDEAFRVARQVRETLMGIPDRVAAELTARIGVTVDPHLVHQVMDQEIRKALEGLPKQEIPDGN